METSLLLIVAGALVAGLVIRALSVKMRARREFRLRVSLEDALKHLNAAEERGRQASVESLAGQLGVPMARAMEIARLLHERGLAMATEGLTLTPAGRRAARQVVRAHRLWERYLADELNVPVEQLHRRADRREHLMATEEVERLAASLGHPGRDPHGDPIPAVDEAPGLLEGLPLTLMPLGEDTEIVHLEDEPEEVLTRLVAQGLDLGQRITVREVAPDRLTVEVDGRRVELSPIDAANVSVVPVRGAERAITRTLDDLRPGERGRVAGVNVSGFARRRLFDLGFTPGAVVECAFASAFGEPKAYRVRGSVIALRPDQARRIRMEHTPEPAER